MYASINGTRIFFDIDGKQFVQKNGVMSEKPVCFVLHGGPGGDHSTYVPSLNPLTRYMQLVYIDYRGNGRSDYPYESTCTMKQNIADIEALRLYLGLKQILLLGHSYGGMMALSYAAVYPHNVQGMILLATACNYRFIERSKSKLREIGSKEQIEMAEKYFFSGLMPDNDTYRRFLRLFAGIYAVTEHNVKAFVNAIDCEILSFKALNHAFAEDLPNYDCSAALPAIKCPVLLIGGNSDWITPIECTREIAAGLPSCKTIIFENCGHAILADQGAAAIKAITEFAAVNFNLQP